jgi:hypothetical protein
MSVRTTALVAALGRGFVLVLLALAAAHAQEEDDAEEVRIEDNSFLIEEAYNQPQGVVQHIFNFVPAWTNGATRQRTFDFVFTQEWPLGSERHQFSYAIPMVAVREWTLGGPVTDARGWGDVMLNYRLQVWDGEGQLPIFSPRFSLIFPTGEEERGIGLGKLGYQVNLPFTKVFDRWTAHFNAGATLTPGVTAGVDPTIGFRGAAINGYNLGGSAIYFLRPNFHLMLEGVCLWDEELTPQGRESQLFEVLVSPGFRWASYTAGDTQVVLGLGLPIGVSRDAPDIAAFFYMSFEHRVRRKLEPDAD